MFSIVECLQDEFLSLITNFTWALNFCNITSSSPLKLLERK